MKINKLTIALSAAIAPALTFAGNTLTAEELSKLSGSVEPVAAVSEVNAVNNFEITDEYRNQLDQLELQEKILKKNVDLMKHKVEIKKQEDLINKSEIKAEIEAAVRSELSNEYQVKLMAEKHALNEVIKKLKVEVAKLETDISDLESKNDKLESEAAASEQKLGEVLSVIKDMDKDFNEMVKATKLAGFEVNPTFKEITLSGISGLKGNIKAVLHHGGNRYEVFEGSTILPELADIKVLSVNSSNVTISFNGEEHVLEPSGELMAINRSNYAINKRYQLDYQAKQQIYRAEYEYQKNIDRLDEILNPKPQPQQTQMGVPLGDATMFGGGVPRNGRLRTIRYATYAR